MLVFLRRWGENGRFGAEKRKMESYFLLFFSHVSTTNSNKIPVNQDRRTLVRVPKDWVNPATMKVRKDTEATVSAYGS